MIKLNKITSNVKKLKPNKIHMELNKCNHIVENFEQDTCPICNAEITPKLSIGHLEDITNDLVKYLETMKMITNCTLSKTEIKATKKYFDMIPLLKNINALYDICYNEYELYLSVLNNDDNCEDSNEDCYDIPVIRKELQDGEDNE